MCNFNGCHIGVIPAKRFLENGRPLGRPFLFCGMYGPKKFSFTATPAAGRNLDNVVTVAEIKSFLRVEHSVDDALLVRIRDAAVEYVQEYTNTLVGPHSCVGYSDGWRTTMIPVGPVTLVNGISYLAQNGGSYLTLDTGYWFTDTDAKPARVRFLSPPSLASDEFNAVKISFSAGFTDVPASMVHAIFMLAANMYEQRLPEVVGTITSATKYGVESLLSTHRIIFAQ